MLSIDSGTVHAPIVIERRMALVVTSEKFGFCHPYRLVVAVATNPSIAIAAFALAV